VPDHNEKNQFSIFLPVLQDYGIVQKLGAIIANNTALNNVLYRTIEAHYKDKEKKEWLAVTTPSYQVIAASGKEVVQG
jgi:hypothetical protein